MSRAPRGGWLAVLPFLVLAPLLAFMSRAWPLVHDAPIMHYIAWRIGQGAAPYRDLFDMNFPGAYLVHLFVLRTLGAGDAAWRAFDLGALAVAMLAMAAFAWRWGVVAAAGSALLFATYHIAGGAWQAGQRDFLLCPFLVVAALGVARWLERGARGAGLPIAGLVLGAGITIKPHAALLAAALALLALGAAWRAGRSVARAALAFAVPLALAPAAAVGWVAARGGIAAWRQIVFDYLLPLYSRLGRPSDWTFYRWHVWIPLAIAVVLSLLSAVGHRRFGARHLIAVLGLGYGLAHFFGQGKGWEYHLYPLAAFTALLAFADLPALAAARRRVLALPLAASLLVVAALLGIKGVEASHADWIAVKTARVDALVADLGPRLRAGDTVQVMDTTDGGIHALLRLGVAEPTRFVYDFHFFHDVDTPVVRAMRAELIAGLTARPPAFVVVFERGWPAGGYERIARFPELAARLAAAYDVVRRGDGYLVYAKRRDS